MLSSGTTALCRIISLINFSRECRTLGASLAGRLVRGQRQLKRSLRQKRLYVSQNYFTVSKSEAKLRQSSKV